MTDAQIGNYQILEEIGRGGMGTVYRGLDTSTGQAVAIKYLKPELVISDSGMIERFAREGEALRQLNHPNIVKVFANLREAERHYLVMEYMSGGSLADLLNRQPALPVSQVLEIALELADALTRAHHLKIIHRDIKPGNVLLAEDGTPRLTDFGVAHMGKAQRITEVGSVVGTLHYLSPEALNGQEIDARSDIWAFGVMLFEMLTGKLPFDGGSMSGIVTSILTQSVPDLEALRPDAPIALVDLIYRMLEKDRQTRIPSARLVGAELEAILQGRDTPTNGLQAGIRQAVSPPVSFETPTPTDNAPKRNLPPQSTAFIGREKEITELGKLLDHTNTRLVTVLAPGGMGKTRLALEVARQTVFPNGVYFVALAPLTSPETIVPAAADAVGFQFYPGGEPKQQLLDYFREKKLLLVMDNFEHVLDGAGIVSEILAYAPSVKVLATSRERLNLSGEVLFALSGMNFPNWETPEDALDYAAVKLFMQSARRARPDFELTGNELAYLGRICRLVAGVPLGIVLAAAWVEMLTLKEIADEIGQSLDFLETELRDVPERQRSIRGVFEYSWNRLADDERDVFKKLSVFRGGFTREAAQAVAGASLKTLTVLVNKSLLRRDPAGRYEVHELLRQYGEQKLDEAQDRSDTAHDAHSTYYLTMLHQREHDLEGGKQIEARDAIERDNENWRAAWLRALQHGKITIIEKAIYSLWLYFFHICQLYIEGETLFELAANALRKLPATSERDDVLEQILLRQVFFTNALHQRQKSEQLLAEVQNEASVSSTPHRRALLKMAHGQFNNEWSNPVEARPFLEEAVALYRQTGDNLGCALALRQLGSTYFYDVTGNQSNPNEAAQILQEALIYFQELGDTFGSTYTLRNRADVVASLGRVEEAQRLYRQILELSQQVGNRRQTATTLMSMAFIAHDQGDPSSELQRLAAEALDIRRELGEGMPILNSLVNFGNWAFLAGDFAQAREYYVEGLTVAQADAYEDWKALMMTHVGRVDWAQGAYVESEACVQTAMQLDEEKLNKREFLCWHLILLGRTALAQGKLEETQRYFEEGIQVAQQMDDPADLGISWQQQALLDFCRSDYRAARQSALTSLGILRTEDAQRQTGKAWGYTLIAESLVSLVDIDRAEGDYAAAQRNMRAALELVWKDVFNAPITLMALASTAELLAKQEQPERAIELSALVQQHPRAYAVTKDKLTELLDTLKSELPPDVYAAAWERGKTLDLNTVVAELLSELDGI